MFRERDGVERGREREGRPTCRLAGCDVVGETMEGYSITVHRSPPQVYTVWDTLL